MFDPDTILKHISEHWFRLNQIDDQDLIKTKQDLFEKRISQLVDLQMCFGDDPLFGEADFITWSLKAKEGFAFPPQRGAFVLLSSVCVKEVLTALYGITEEGSE